MIVGSGKNPANNDVEPKLGGKRALSVGLGGTGVGGIRVAVAVGGGAVAVAVGGTEVAVEVGVAVAVAVGVKVGVTAAVARAACWVAAASRASIVCCTAVL